MEETDESCFESLVSSALNGIMSNPVYFNHTPERVAQDAVRAAIATQKLLMSIRFEKED